MEVEFSGTKKNNYMSKECEHEAEETKKIIKEFGSYTTLHGFHFIFDSSSLIRKIIWVVLLVLGLSFLMLQFRDNWRKLYSNRSTISREIEHNESVIFPAISLCNQNMMRKSKVLGTYAQTFLDQQDELKIQFEGPSIFEQEIPESFDIEESVRRNSHNLTEMLKMCSWIHAPCTAANFTPFLSYMRGVCHTFNSGKPGHRKLHVTTSGKTQSFTIYLDAQPEEYYGPYSYDATGFKLLIHEQRDSYPNIEDFAIDISPGFTTNVRLLRKKIKRLPPPYSSGCGEKNLTAFDEYSEYACLAECYTKIAVNTCNCRLLSMPSLDKVNKTRFCTANELFNCLYPLFGDFNPSRCECPPPCTQIYYQVQTSMAYAPSNHLWDTIFALYNNSGTNETNLQEFQNYIRRRMAQVNIYYESLETEVTIEKEAYDLTDFGSDVGGNMGLFLGCSLLTLCEFVDLIVIMCLRCWRKRNVVDLKTGGQ